MMTCSSRRIGLADDGERTTAGGIAIALVNEVEVGVFGQVFALEAPLPGLVVVGCLQQDLPPAVKDAQGAARKALQVSHYPGIIHPIAVGGESVGDDEHLLHDDLNTSATATAFRSGDGERISGVVFWSSQGTGYCIVVEAFGGCPAVAVGRISGER